MSWPESLAYVCVAFLALMGLDTLWIAIKRERNWRRLQKAAPFDRWKRDPQ